MVGAAAGSREQYVLEVTAAEVPVQYFKDWLAEWGREIRRRQTGLMLLLRAPRKGTRISPRRRARWQLGST